LANRAALGMDKGIKLEGEAGGEDEGIGKGGTGVFLRFALGRL